MASYQPLSTHPVEYDSQPVNTIGWAASMLGVRIARMAGWIGEVDWDDAREARAGDHGEDPNTARMRGRTITLEGEVYGSSWDDLQVRKRALAAIFTPRTEDVLLRVPLPDYATSAAYERTLCRVSAPIVFGDMTGSSVQAWQVSLRASDPRIYADALITATDTTATSGRLSVDLANTGSVEAPAVMKLSGANTAQPSFLAGLVVGGVHTPESTVTLDTGATLTGAQSATVDGDARDIQTILTGLSSLVAPRAWWKLDEASGAQASNAQSGASFHAAYAGTITYQTPGALSALVPNVGVIAGAGSTIGFSSASFNDIGRGVGGAFTDAFGVTTSGVEWQLVVWVKAGSASKDFRWGDAATRGFRLRFDATTQATFSTWKADGTEVTTNVEASTSEYRCYVVSRNSAKSYVIEAYRPTGVRSNIGYHQYLAGAGVQPMQAGDTFSLAAGTGAYTVDNVMMFHTRAYVDRVIAYWASRSNSAFRTVQTITGWPKIQRTGTTRFSVEAAGMTSGTLSVSYRPARV